MKKSEYEVLFRALKEVFDSFAESESGEPELPVKKPAISLDSSSANPFEPRGKNDPFSPALKNIHQLGTHFVCETDTKGFARPEDRSPLELRVDASEGFIPLWAPGRVLRWRFDETSFAFFRDPEAATNAVRVLFGDAIDAWGDSAPIRFSESGDAYDFQISMQPGDRCSTAGCTLAASFFPDAGRHTLKIYPKMFLQSRKEQVDTFIHELGHVFGLRHFFANVSESAFPSEEFGKQERFTIMNYGAFSELTATDKKDLKTLYQMVWSRQLRAINGTPIRLVTPFHETPGML